VATYVPHFREPLYHQLADIIRKDIEHGKYAPGSRLPTEPELGELHGFRLMTVRRALAILREEGRITTERGKGTVVRIPAPRTPVVLTPESRLTSRMPSSTERARLGIDSGVPLLVIRYPDGHTETHAADRVEIVGEPGS